MTPHYVQVGVLYNQAATYFSRFAQKREVYTKAMVAVLVTLMTAKLLTDMLGIYYAVSPTMLGQNTRKPGADILTLV